MGWCKDCKLGEVDYFGISADPSDDTGLVGLVATGPEFSLDVSIFNHKLKRNRRAS